jgi:hypothetical protein
MEEDLFLETEREDQFKSSYILLSVISDYNKMLKINRARLNNRKREHRLLKDGGYMQKMWSAR